MSQNKVVILVLILIAATFAVVVARGTLTKDKPQTGNQKAAANFANQDGTAGWREMIEKVFAAFQPKLELACGAGNQPSAKCQNVQLKSPLRIAPDASQTMRTAAFRLVKGSAAEICYRVDENAPSCATAKNSDESAKPDFNAQSFDLPNSQIDDPAKKQRGTIVVLKNGGVITIKCADIEQCRVDLE